ncbi:hypothetical protein MesoLjLc_57270 [Mesorhizobium sp. L-8-10]|uniref:hypothetical protein n=1 Tax=Mesorhizobium sp. L-8-10 TaxID=2744523 RepID=UPI0019283899|nr:hypothetical protein [Mesorhizobium sp. L-8-10]BCH33797.1 hypothetical protein MesoLjLc_57270 [Mesorhizobium sp. L-8-10]
MRFFFLLMLLAGAVLGIGYPFVIQNFSGKEIGSWRVYERGSGFHSIETKLSAADVPVRVLVDMTSIGAPRLTNERTVLTITAATGGRTVLAETLNFVDAAPRADSPQSGERVYRDDGGVISDASDGPYVFTVGPGDAEGIEMKSVDLILRAGAASYDERAQPLGFALMGIGFIGFVLALRRGGHPPNPNSQPPRSRWGRGAGGRS